MTVKRMLLFLCSAALLTGCTAPGSMPSAVQTAPEESEVICDQLYVNSEENYTFLAFKSPEASGRSENGWLFAENWEPVHAFRPETDYPEGSFVQITADVHILNGGEAGYCCEPEIQRLIDVKPVDFAEALEQVTAPDETAEYWQRVRKISTAGSTYLVIYDEVVYREGAPVGDYSRWSDDRNGALWPLYETPLLLDYLMPNSLPRMKPGADVIIGGFSDPAGNDPDWLIGSLTTVCADYPDYVLDRNAEPLTPEQLRKCRESGIFLFLRPKDCELVWFGDEQEDYLWASLCSETTDGDLTLTLHDGRSFLLKHEALGAIMPPQSESE